MLADRVSDGLADPVRQLFHGIEISQRQSIGIWRKDRKHASHGVLHQYRRNDNGAHSELPTNFLINPGVGLGITAPLRHLAADGQSGEAGLMIDRFSDRSHGQASCGATSHRTVAEQTNGNAGGACLQQSALGQDL
jgi:hypothetical protein